MAHLSDGLVRAHCRVTLAASEPVVVSWARGIDAGDHDRIIMKSRLGAGAEPFVALLPRAHD